MDYPQGFIFLKEKTKLESLSTLQAWFTADVEIYLQGQSPNSKVLDQKIKNLSEIHRFVWKKSDYQMQCIAFNHTMVSHAFLWAHNSDVLKVYWIDSKEHHLEVSGLAKRIKSALQFSYLLHELEACHMAMANYIFAKTGQTMLDQTEVDRLMMGRAWGTPSEIEIHMRKIAKSETRAGLLRRIDLEHSEEIAA